MPITATVGSATTIPSTSNIGSQKAASDGLTAKPCLTSSCAIFAREETNALSSTANQYRRTNQCVVAATMAATALNKRKSWSVMRSNVRPHWRGANDLRYVTDAHRRVQCRRLLCLYLCVIENWKLPLRPD